MSQIQAIGEIVKQLTQYAKEYFSLACIYFSNIPFSVRIGNWIFIFSFTLIIVLIRMVRHILHDVLKSQPGLSRSWNDLIGWEEEAIVTSVTQLKGKGVFDTTVVTPVNASTTSLI